MSTTLNTTAKITNLLQACPRTAKELASLIEKSESVVRENLVKLVEAGSVQKIGDKKPTMFGLVPTETPKPEKKGRTKKAAAEPKAKRQAKDFGDPAAKKSPNPQSTIRARQEKLKAEGIDCHWEPKGRRWIVEGHDHSLELASRQFAAMSAQALIDAIKSGEEIEDEGDDE